MQKTTKFRKTIAILLALALVIPSIGAVSFANTEPAATVFFNGVIYTVETRDDWQPGDAQIATDDWHLRPADAMAVDGNGIILYVGTREGAMAYAGQGTSLVDLGGKAVLPGMVDSHNHTTRMTAEFWAGLNRSVFLSIPHVLEEIERDIRAFVAMVDEKFDGQYEYFTGWAFAMSSFPVPSVPGQEFLPGYKTPALWLDSLTGGRPMLLTSTDGHNRMASQSLFDYLGITVDTPVLGGSMHVYDGYLWGTVSGGGATGMLHLGPVTDPTLDPTDPGYIIRPALVNPSWPDRTAAEQRIIDLTFQDKMLGWGVTQMLALPGGFNDAPIRRFIELERSGDWFMRANVGLGIQHAVTKEQWETQYALFKTNRDFYERNSNLFRSNTVKFFLDSVVEGGSAWMLDPYDNNVAQGEHVNWRAVPRQNFNVARGYTFADENPAGALYQRDGVPFRDPEIWPMFSDLVKQITRDGVNMHVHAIGDAAVRAALDSIEDALAAHPEAVDNHRHTITHLHQVHPLDRPRFGELAVIASTQTFWHPKDGEAPDWYVTMDEEFVGKIRGEAGYPVMSLIVPTDATTYEEVFDARPTGTRGAVIAFSSDHPVTMFPNPFVGIEIAVTRNKSYPYLGGSRDIALQNAGVDPATWDWNHPKFLRNANERVSVKTAVEAWTLNGAYLNFKEDTTGSLEVGKFADFIVIDQDIMRFTTGAEFVTIGATQVLATYVAGQLVWERDDPTVIRVYVDGNRLAVDQPPILQDGRTLVPMRAIYEALGADVEWDNYTRTVTGVIGDVTVVVQIGNNIMTINGYEVELDVAPLLIGGRTLVPTRAVSEAFGATVSWDSATRTVTVVSP